MVDIGILKETTERVLENLLKLFDYKWEHIEADNYHALADAIFDDSDVKEGQKRQANETNLDLDQCNKKLKTKQHSKNPTSKMRGNDKREFAGAPLQQGQFIPPQTVYEGKRAHLQFPSSIKQPHKDTSTADDTAITSSSVVAGIGQNSSDMRVIPHQLHIGADRPPHDVNDITKGEERLSIPIVNEFGSGILPPRFHYISHNITLQEAYVNISLARIGDDNCCSDCFGDCLAQPLPCACATETGGEFVYTRDGLLKEKFLDTCISMLREPLKHPRFYCKICPHERRVIEANSDSSNTEVSHGPCKGHITRKFIKECWSKCGCTRNCGNRVVQRGITRHLQVFLTPGKKGWGLRSTEKLPRGAFICEYAGEILTNTELYERTIQKTGKAKHTYPLLLDADWGTEGVLKDEEALCLDATFYGNVARFINHRCFDANIIGIPVEIETPDHHYYHLAFFTTREVEPFEELTWDYGIDFDDVDHPIKAFKCHCGSEFCGDKRRISRSKSKAQVLG
ncbi:hypothetical protein ABZP36_031406 [Zizania latifolia]